MISKETRTIEVSRSEANLGPGAYDAGIQPFTKDVKGGKIMPKGREPAVQGSHVGPGTYNTIEVQRHTTVNMSSSPGRVQRNNFVNEDNMGPGGYDAGGSFGKGTKNFTFPPSPKKSPQGDSGGGPGTYDASDSVTKVRPQQCSFANQTGRKHGKFDGDNDSPEMGPTTTVPRFYTYPKEVPIYSIAEKREPKP